MRPGSRPCSVPRLRSVFTSTTEIRATPGQTPAMEAAAFPRIDWVGALDVSHFTGREGELAELSHWIVHEQCRLVAILGMGGIGKSALVSLLGKQLAPQFDAVLWRSLRDAPSCEELVADCITFFSETPPTEFPPLLEQRINQLIGRLQERRCLLVLDNLETLLEVEDPEGNYRPGYQGYGRLIERLGESAHQSCVVLTSREKPREIEALEGPRGPVRSLRLLGLSQEAARSLLADKDLRGASSAWRQLDRHLRGQSARAQDRGPGHRRSLCRRHRPVPAIGGADLQWHPRGAAPAGGAPDAAGADAAHLAGGGARVDVARFLALPARQEANARTGAGGLGSTLATVPDRAGSGSHFYAAIGGDGVRHRCPARSPERGDRHSGDGPPAPVCSRAGASERLRARDPGAFAGASTRGAAASRARIGRARRGAVPLAAHALAHGRRQQPGLWPGQRDRSAQSVAERPAWPGSLTARHSWGVLARGRDARRDSVRGRDA